MLRFFERTSLDKYFIEEEHPYTHKRRIKKGAVRFMLFLTVTVLILFIVIFGDDSKSLGEKGNPPPKERETNRASSPPDDSPRSGDFNYVTVPHHETQTTRSFTASQIVRPGNGNASGDNLPTGSLLQARLVNTVLSSDSESPVIAELTEDVLWKNSVVIPQGSRAIGRGSLDSTTQRLKARFDTLVYPDGSQHALSGLALLADGSSGIPGNYHTQALKKDSGKFLGDFVGGLAQGLKERRSDGQLGLPYEPGSLKNGILTGVTAIAQDHAQSFSEDMKNIQPYLEVPQLSLFLIYLEREYTP